LSRLGAAARGRAAAARPPADGAPVVAAGDRRALRRAVLGYGGSGLRPLPWRATRDPWAVLVSEVMLQQTQAGRVVEPYERFMDAFPTPVACAGAGLASVVRAWDGLGYNRRARDLHGAATAVVERHGGRVPADLAALRALPGVGEYTARAVLAFAFEHRVAAVDVNVHRVLARAVAGSALSRRHAQQLADGLVPSGDAWAWNQALIELGALVCTARRPACGRCPLARRCAWAGGPAVPDPAPRRTAPSRFEGSDRQGRGRLLSALRAGPVPWRRVASACGWPDDASRARRVAQQLVSDGLARLDGGALVLP
jgi:A/G-specific adenine glycosylase